MSSRVWVLSSKRAFSPHSEGCYHPSFSQLFFLSIRTTCRLSQLFQVKAKWFSEEGSCSRGNIQDSKATVSRATAPPHKFVARRINAGRRCARVRQTYRNFSAIKLPVACFIGPSSPCLSYVPPLLKIDETRGVRDSRSWQLENIHVSLSTTRAGMTCHARRGIFRPKKLQYFLSSKYIQVQSRQNK